MLLAKAKLSEVVISNVEIPTSARIQVVSKSPRYAESGEPIQGSVAKISCKFIDTNLAKLIEKGGAETSELKTYPLELVGDEKDLLELSPANLIDSEISLKDAKVMLKWEQGQGKNAGGWKGLKLVLNISDESTGE